MHKNSTPAKESVHMQRAWDSIVCKKHEQLVWSHVSTDIDKARLLAAASPHSGDWLAAPSITFVGLRLSDEQLRISIAHRLGCNACEPHTCGCGKVVDARGLHGLVCRKSAPRQQRHSHLNNIIWRAMKRAQIPSKSQWACFGMTANSPTAPQSCHGRGASCWYET